jgi:hypothetical protein
MSDIILNVNSGIETVLIVAVAIIIGVVASQFGKSLNA